jgi:RNA-directed DNA polymerase
MRNACAHTFHGLRGPRNAVTCTDTAHGTRTCLRTAELRGWAHYFRHAVAKHVFTKVDDIVWWRLVRLLRERHHWNWRDFRRRSTTPSGRWLPISAGEIRLRKISAIPVTRYRYRGNKIPNPWVPETA